MEDVRAKCIHAFQTGNKEKALELLSKVHQPQTITTEFEKRTLVHDAAWHGWDDVCKLLVEKYDCDPTAKDGLGKTPLHLACRKGQVSSVNYLLTLPKVLSTINDMDDDGHTPLHIAYYFSRMPVVEILLTIPSVTVDWNKELSVSPSFNVFLTGNSGAGKSTLAAVLIELARSTPSQHGQVSDIKTLTEGVCPIRCGG